MFDATISTKSNALDYSVRALKYIAARSVARKRVVCTKRIAEGGFNRVCLLTMNDGFEIIAKIPCAVPGPKTYATESEVATLDFLRSKGVPAPQVYSYSSQSDSPVGSEYIVMGKARGQPYVELEQKLFSINFISYGSLYYTDKLPPNIRAPLYDHSNGYESHDEMRFCISPSADYTFWRGRRALLNIDRGPWHNHQDYIRFIVPHNIILKGNLSSSLYLELLEKYLSMVPHILPESRSSPVIQPTLRHPDHNPSNISVTESGEISCIIDWQHSSILPLLLTAGNPPLFENPDPEPPKNLEKPSLPEDYVSLSPEEQTQADELHRRRMLFYLYMVFNGKDNKPHLDALRDPLLALRQHLVDRAGRQWSGNTITLKGALLRLAARWDQLAGESTVECPVQFEPEETKQFYDTEDQWFRATILLEHWRSLLDDLGEGGSVRHKSYNRVVETNRQLKEHWLAEAEDDENYVSVDKFWPFQDHEEID
ncbi:hypothetical protein P168DRAFT_343353 [Aspergillus campestris IBT 28561]|uniref:Aminoglycoside phosphotransferase domain-containing protein n=1 Tax=Aspergillus campestris (strain IBT 28561) TaxID=1392248 RepID=A0A2I1D2M5_ASPC2|nr:uncharacterized protein P168DRAFT_343353 [Aspergillus campestris IBT 28561]PKY04125.1 hypothetical protein P168DRAFT_343353 [Aspergillus campestris IBT 28561]